MIKAGKSITNLGTVLSGSEPKNIHSLQKSVLAISKSSSEGLSTLDGWDTAITSMEDNKMTNGQELTHTLQNSSPLIHLENTETNEKLLPSIENTATHKGLSQDENNFKVSIRFDDSLVQMHEDTSTPTSSSEDITGFQQNAALKARANSAHSYRVLAEPTPTIKNDDDTISNVDPLTPIVNNEQLIPLPNSEPIFQAGTETRASSYERRINTYPKSTVEDTKKNNILATTRNKSFTNGTKVNTDKRNFHNINTIKIPDNYQRTELAVTTGVDHHQQHHHNLKSISLTHKSVDTDYPKRHRVSKTSSFINNPRIKAKMKADDLYNIPGQSISENHENYAIVYDLVTGIRFAVSRCSKTPINVTDDSFKQVTKLIFSREGNTQAPPTKYEFKFKDYTPDVFRDLRDMFNVNQADYLMSLNDEIGVKAVGSSGKSGSSFYYSNDRKFIIKTIHRSEHRHLRKILKEYYHYVKKNPNTLLCQFYGLHRLKMTTRTGTVKVHVLVMNNLLPLTVNINNCYDLKGSTHGRKTSEKKRLSGSCMKDLNFIEDNSKIHLSKIKRKEVETQLTKDVDLLKRLNIMDYSLLLGIRYLNGTDDEDIDEESRRLSAIVHQEVPGAHKNTIIDMDGGIRAIDINDEEMDIVYYIGIIDCLTNYSTFKKLETFFRSLKYKRETISAVPPNEYGDRFLKFIFDHIESPGTCTTRKEKGFGKLKY